MIVSSSTWLLLPVMGTWGLRADTWSTSRLMEAFMEIINFSWARSWHCKQKKGIGDSVTFWKAALVRPAHFLWIHVLQVHSQKIESWLESSMLSSHTGANKYIWRFFLDNQIDFWLHDIIFIFLMGRKRSGHCCIWLCIGHSHSRTLVGFHITSKD